MYVPPFPVYDDETFEIPLPSRDSAGAAVTAGTWADADFKFYKDGSTTAATIDASATTPSSDFDSDVGKSQLQVLTANDSAFTLGSRWQVWAEKTIDGTAINECICVFRMETEPEKAARLLRAAVYPNDPTISTTAGNTPTTINLTDIANPNAEAGDYAGEILLVQYQGGTYDGLSILVRVTSYAVTNQIAVVEQINGDNMPEAVAAGDYVWRVGQFTAMTDSLAEIANQASIDAIDDDTSALLTRVSDTIPFSAAGNVQVDLQELLENQLAEGGSAPGSPIGYQ